MSSRLLILWKGTDTTWWGGKNYTVRKPRKHIKTVICMTHKLHIHCLLWLKAWVVELYSLKKCLCHYLNMCIYAYVYICVYKCSLLPWSVLWDDNSCEGLKKHVSHSTQLFHNCEFKWHLRKAVSSWLLRSPGSITAVSSRAVQAGEVFSFRCLRGRGRCGSKEWERAAEDLGGFLRGHTKSVMGRE